ncbi:hypothetical protein [Alcaligenes aquatilis]|uniref:hypothetical protein n=1 Tax=Alcaligenes aquatilis TaxID=323284 RepID=UPI000D52B2CC|nr:hypothetical protein [Alcaligenes aquatilis]AWG34026.1 hypothetical protein CA948_02230 [Alcaligenes aquatilis]
MSRIDEGRLVVTPHPLTLEGQTNTPADLKAGESLLSFLERHVPNLHVCKYAVSINGCPISPDHWSRVKPKHGTVIAVRSVVEKEALQLVALAALTYFTFGIGSAGGFVATSFGKLAATAVFMAGSMLINKVLAPPMPEIGSTDFGREPTYSIAPGSNRARQHEALPLLLGSIQYAPDYASLPYTWYEGNEQVLGAVFNAGLNVDRFEGALLNGDTELSAYQDVSVWTRGFPGMPEQDIPLFTNPDVSDGGELEGSGEWVTRTTSLDTTLIQCDFEIQLFGQGKKGIEGRNLVLEGRYRPVGAAQWRPIQSIYLNNRAMKPLRRTETIPVESGQYEVAWRNATGGSSDDGKTTRNAVWTQMKSIQPDDGDYLGQSRIGIKVKATGQLNGSLKEIKGRFVARAMPIWNGSSWGVATTPDNGLSNPGAQILLLARGIYVDDPFYGRKLIAGMGLPDDQIDIEGLKAFMLHCTANDLRHDALISDDRSNVDLLNQVARCGLGSFGFFNGKWGVVWAWDNQPLDGVVNMATIKKSTFQASYELASAADGIVYTYLNRETWEQDALYVYAPGKTVMLNPARITGEGVTTTEHAAVMARYHLGQSLYQFKDIQYETDLEHLDYQRMSVLAISHDMTQWGFGGRLVAAAQDEQGVVTLHLDSPVPDQSVHGAGAAEPFIGLRVPGESIYRVFRVVRPSAGALTLQLKDPWPEDALFPGEDGDNPAHDTLWFYDFKPTPGARVRVAGMQMQADLGGAQVAVVPESDEFWDYVINGTYEPAGSDSELSRDETPVVHNLRVTEQQTVQGNTQFTELTITFDAKGELASAEVWAGPEGQELAHVADTFTRQATFRIDVAGNWMVQVRPMGHTRAGPAASIFYVTQVTDLPPWNYDSLLITEIAGGLRRYVFEYIENDPPLDLAGAEIRHLSGKHAAPVWDAMTPLGSGFHTATFESVLPQEGDWTFALRARNTSGQLSTDTLIRTVKLGKNFDQVQTVDKTPPPAVTGLAAVAGLGTVIVRWDRAVYETGHGHARTIVYAAKGATATVSSAKPMAESHNGPVSFSAGLGETWRVWAKHESVDGVLSSAYAGPVNVTLGKVGDADLAEDLDLAKRLADGSITAEKLADGALTETKFAQGVEPVKIIPDSGALPTTKSTSSVLWKGTLYVWNAVSKKYEKAVADVAPESLGPDKFLPGTEPVTTILDSGQLPTSKVTTTVSWKGVLYVWNAATKKYEKAVADVAPESLGPDKFLPGTEPVTVIANNKPLPTVKSTSSIVWRGKLYRWDGTKYVSSVDAGDIAGKITDQQIADMSAAKLTGEIAGTQIADNAIKTPHLAAGSVAAEKIAAGAVIASKLFVGANGNLIPNGAGEMGLDQAKLGWPSRFAVDETNAPDGFPWSYRSPAGETGTRDSTFYPIPVEPGAEYQITIWAMADRADSRVYIEGRNQSGAHAFKNAKGDGGSHVYVLANRVLPTSWTRFSTTVTISDGTTHLHRFRYYINHANGTERGAAQSFAGLTMVKRATGELIVDGVITADKVAVNAISADSIQANAVTAGKIAAGSVGADHVQAGAITASKVTLSDFTNLITNSQLNDADAWTLDTDVIRVLNPGNGAAAGSFRIPGDITVNRYARFKGVAVTPGTSYLMSAHYRASSAAGRKLTPRFGVMWLDKDGGYIQENLFSASDVLFTTYAYREAVFTAPEGAVIAVCLYGRLATDQINEGFIELPSFRAMTGGSLIVDGAISADKVAANAISVEKIAANAVTTAKIAAGAVTADQIAANSITAEKLVVSSPTNLIPDTFGWTERTNASSWRRVGFGLNNTNGSVWLQHKISVALDTLFEVRKGTQYLFSVEMTCQTDGARQVFEVVKEDGDSFSPRRFLGSFFTSSDDYRLYTNGVEFETSERVRLKVFANDNQAASTGGYMWIRNPSLRAMAQGELIVDGAITADKVATNAVTADKIAANAITAAKISAGAVGAEQIAANAITAKHLVVADRSNLHPDPTVSLGGESALWSIPSWVAAVPPGASTVGWGFSGGVLRATAPNPGTVWNGPYLRTGNIELQGGQDYVLSFRHRRFNAGTSVFRTVVYFYDANGEYISGANALLNHTTSSATPQDVVLPVTAPEKAATMQIYYQQYPDTSTSGFIVGDFFVRRAASAEMIVDGAITADKLAAGSVVAGKLAANSVAANNIAAGAITADKLAADSVTAAKLAAGSVNASKIEANAVTADKLAANSVTAVKIAANAVTADKIQAGTITAESGVIANGAITNAHLNNAIVTTAKIADGAISRAKIQTAAIGEAQIDNAVITSGKIRDAAITRAKIGHAEVDTLRIAGNAVTIHASATAPTYHPPGWTSERRFSLSFYLPHAADFTLSASIAPNGSSPGFSASGYNSIWYDTGGYEIGGIHTATDSDRTLNTGGATTVKGWLSAGSHSITMIQKPSAGSSFLPASMTILIAMR